MLASGLPKMEESCDNNAALLSALWHAPLDGLVVEASVDRDSIANVVLVGGSAKTLVRAEASVYDGVKVDSSVSDGSLFCNGSVSGVSPARGGA